MDSLGGQFQKFRWTKLLPSPPLWGYSNNPKKGGLIQETSTLRTTFESRFLAYPPIYTRVEAIGGGVGAFREGGGHPAGGTLRGTRGEAISYSFHL